MPDSFSLRLTLPSGGTVEFNDPEDITGGDMEDIMRSLKPEALMGGVDTNDPGAVVTNGLDALAGVTCVLITDWSIPYAPGKQRQPAAEPWPLPSTDASLLRKLSARDWRAVVDHVSPVVGLVMPGAVSPDDAAVPGSPTVPDGG